MNYSIAVKLKKVSVILALVFALALFVGPYTAFASDLETLLNEPVLPQALNLNSSINSITGPVAADSSEVAAIKAIQLRLVNLGYDTGGIDGIYGPKTMSAVILFQESHNLIVDGIVGPQTRAALGF
ncbi:peptidoglycan-binding protein [Pelotomaculum isophthalicicum JI]|uniref:Peptidoglycan-binding protein n=1 Tax=Pelotomaculum isophthalicicum JI TaxID=947010 RepID=A0A9X4H1T6_9FIRM|nr:peptidoglycan-binding domain-containing protein [Pelotomaculum isophthalicicum]MDF9408421.1 peptidoglycan-binding protein [Pelotomaculum isophthalicicum JI]